MLRAIFIIILLFCAAPPIAFAAKRKVKPRPGPPPVKKEEKPSGLMEFGKDVATEVDKIIRKNDFTMWGDPWQFQGIPLVFYSGGNGFHLGFKANIQNIRRDDPHLFELQAQALASDKGRNKHYVYLDFPHAFDDRFQVTARFAYDREISFRYYGIGNDTTVNSAALERGDYDTVQGSPSIQLEALYRFGKHFRLGPLVGITLGQRHGSSRLASRSRTAGGFPRR